jgi:hypothetical protein
MQFTVEHTPENPVVLTGTRLFHPIGGPPLARMRTP